MRQKRVWTVVLVLALVLALAPVAWTGGGSAGRPADGSGLGVERRPGLRIAQTTGSSGQALLAGLTAGDWATIKERIRQAEYHLTWHEPSATYQAPNRAHGWHVAFSATGVRVSPGTSQELDGGWSWGLTLTGYGYEGQVQSVVGNAAQTVGANRVEYHHQSAIVRLSAHDAVRNPQSFDTAQERSNIVEWYVNDERGLEQGFTIPSPLLPRSSAPLLLELALSGNLIPHLTDGGTAIEFTTPPLTSSGQSGGVRVLRYSDLRATDATGRQLPAHLELTRSRTTRHVSRFTFQVLRLIVDDTNAVYPIIIDPLLTQVAQLTASDGVADDRFGISVAISGDTLVVGAYRDDVGGNSDQGSVYVFERNRGGADHWGQVSKLTASDGAAGDWFGRSAAISGDTLVVGAYYDDAGGNEDQGSAYVFARNQGGADNWGQVRKLTASDGAVGDWFGHSVAISGDTLVVGAYSDDVGGNQHQGSAYVFARNQGGADNWGEVNKLTASDGATSDQFGFSVAIGGDTLVVGTLQGSAYVFARNQGGADNWGQVDKLTASDGAAYDHFGISVAISGDTLVVGAHGDVVGGNRDQGSAYVFARNQGGADNWGQVRKLTASDGATGDLFGRSVTISGDTVVVGAYYDDVGGNENQGSAYVFARNQGGADNWGQVAQLTASDGAADDRFGGSVAISGDTLVVGAPFDDVGGNDEQGSAYTFVRQVSTWEQEGQSTASDGAAGDRFGGSVAISGDTLVVGAHLDDVGGNDEQGSAYVFACNQGGADHWGQVRKLTASDGAVGDLFGYSVAISGDTLVVGANYDDVGGNENQGSAYVFARNQGGADNWGQVSKLTVSDGAAGDWFGGSVAISGDTLVVGAVGHSVGGNYKQGSAYVFARNQGGADNWGQVRKLTASDGAAGDWFGRSAAISGDTLVVGAYSDDVGGNDAQGSAYVFARNQGGADQWGQVRKLTASDGAAGDWFGISVAISGDTLVVGAGFDDVDGNEHQGSVYVFARNQGGADDWGQVRKLTASDGAADDLFGIRVAISGDALVVGAHLDDVGGNEDQGSTYVYRLSRLNAVHLPLILRNYVP